ncbi:MAG: collagen-like protein, partial [Parvularcula sp.]|nr:collagen-like protein [Parvularcula sp.]
MMVIAYKAFNTDWTCRDFQYEVGKTFTHEGDVEICSSGFHACLHPLDCFGYYPPAGSRFAIVEMPEVKAGNDCDTKVCAASITIKAELQLGEMIEAAVKHVFDAAKWVKSRTAANDREAAKATGIRGAASATGIRGAASATGYSGAASATGDRGAASATGIRGAASATGDRGAASATGD